MLLGNTSKNPSRQYSERFSPKYLRQPKDDLERPHEVRHLERCLKAQPQGRAPRVPPQGGYLEARHLEHPLEAASSRSTTLSFAQEGPFETPALNPRVEGLGLVL
ncbi:hypothetical protein Salat_1168600 [Sesamum alatum]|uniref:Uncharacterized protein n=1 Tax=Sesamum alatum TaxID=300844 RepID=A0AAE2CNH4_9LAMI|nr:hypothetical protein Salat_1168600 [Sesamum alatum]